MEIRLSQTPTSQESSPHMLQALMNCLTSWSNMLAWTMMCGLSGIATLFVGFELCKIPMSGLYATCTVWRVTFLLIM